MLFFSASCFYIPWVLIQRCAFVITSLVLLQCLGMRYWVMMEDLVERPGFDSPKVHFFDIDFKTRFSVRFSVKWSSVSCFSKSKNKALCSFHKEVPAPFRIQKLLDGCSPTSFPGSADVKRSPVFQKVNLLMAAVVRLRLRFSLLGLHSRASQFAPPQPLSAPWSLFE